VRRLVVVVRREQGRSNERAGFGSGVRVSAVDGVLDVLDGVGGVDLLGRAAAAVVAGIGDPWQRSGDYVSYGDGSTGCVRCRCDETDLVDGWFCRGCRLFMCEISDEDPAARERLGHVPHLDFRGARSWWYGGYESVSSDHRLSEWREGWRPMSAAWRPSESLEWCDSRATRRLAHETVEVGLCEPLTTSSEQVCEVPEHLCEVCGVEVFVSNRGGRRHPRCVLHPMNDYDA